MLQQNLHLLQEFLRILSLVKSVLDSLICRALLIAILKIG
jgi:hypothetical protein